MRIERDRFLVFGHRGCPLTNPENTLPSFAECIRKGIPGAELDVHLTKDGKLVVAHDFTLERTSFSQTVIEETDFLALEKENVGAYLGKKERIPLLEEVLELGKGKLYFDIELKANALTDHGLEKLVWETIQKQQMAASVLVSSFNPLSLRRFNKISRGAVDSGVIYSNGKDIPRIIRGGRCRHIAKATYLKPDWRETKQAKDWPVIPWAVDKEEDIRAMLELHVSGIISNNPCTVLEVLGKERRPY